jgi:predicted kinase
MKPTLYLFVGYPGAGKTHIAKMIADRTGARHLWADIIRQEMFMPPTHSRQESKLLYDRLNLQTAELLTGGISVIFDTNFGFYQDRELLRKIATDAGAATVLIWVKTPEDWARDRAVCGHTLRNGYTMNMSDEDFDRIISNIEPPIEDEQPIEIDGSNLSPETVFAALNI